MTLLSIVIYITTTQCSLRLEKENKDIIPRDQVELRPATVENSNVTPIDLRSIKDWRLTDLLLVSDIDGNLHGIERNSGAVLWTLPIEEPLVKIATNRSGSHLDKENTQSNIRWFVEPYKDGSLYYFVPRFGLNKLPTSIKDLVLESPFSLSGDDKIYTGTRKTSLFTINIYTGEIKSVFGNEEKCPNPNTHYHSQDLDHQDTIMLGKTTYELSIHSKVETNVVWNVTYSQWGPNNIDNDLIVQNQQSMDKLYFTPFHDKSLLAINKDIGTPIWISKLPLLAVNVFDVFNNMKSLNEHVVLPHPLKYLNDLQTSSNDQSSNSDLCFINKTSNSQEWFAMSFNNYPTLIKSAPISEYQMALYKLSHQNNDINIDHLKNFQLYDSNEESTNNVEHLISGIHRFNHLTSDNMYQPVSRFMDFADEEIKRIGDGSASDQDIVNEENCQIPNIIDGIKLSKSPTRNSMSLSTTLNNPNNKQDLLLIDSGSSEKHLSSLDNNSNTITYVSIIKRICEDIIVILVVLALLMSFGKFGKLGKRLKFFLHEKSITLDSEQRTGNNISNNKVLDTVNPEDNIKVEKIDVNISSPNFERTNSIESSNSNDSSNIDIVHNKKEPNVNSDKSTDGNATTSEKNTKKVTIITPNESLEKSDSNINEQAQSDDIGNNEESNNESNYDDVPTKKKRKRGSRGGKRGGKNKKTLFEETNDSQDKDSANSDIESAGDTINTKSLTKFKVNKSPAKKLQIENNLIITDKILGYGSHGTIVYEGTFENRPVAVKRMLLDFYDIANHEVKLLQESDDHPNVIRYFCSQLSETEKFLYIALELCLCSLEDIVEKPKTFPKDIRLQDINISDLLHQLASGLHYLHSLKIVHRDLKPQNILVADLKKSVKGSFVSSIRLLISDFGLCKKLDADQSSFRATTQNAALGTSGWRAPELLLQHDLLEISPDTISSINSSISHSMPNSNGKRLTKAIDIFSLGCVFFYILTKGSHPFGDRYLREGNIIKGEYDLSPLKSNFSGSHYEVSHLISSMINHNPKLRPDTSTILKHPYFWPMSKKLDFLLKVSDRFEIEKRDPPSELLLQLESISLNVHQGNWHEKFDNEFMDNLGKYRKYQPEKLMDLLRAIRNKYHHFNDMPVTLQQQMCPLPNGFYKYFSEKFPNLLMEIYFVVEANLKHEHIFEEFYM